MAFINLLLFVPQEMPSNDVLAWSWAEIDERPHVAVIDEVPTRVVATVEEPIYSASVTLVSALTATVVEMGIHGSGTIDETVQPFGVIKETDVHLHGTTLNYEGTA